MSTAVRVLFYLIKATGVCRGAVAREPKAGRGARGARGHWEG